MEVTLKFEKGEIPPTKTGMYVVLADKIVEGKHSTVCMTEWFYPSMRGWSDKNIVVLFWAPFPTTEDFKK